MAIFEIQFGRSWERQRAVAVEGGGLAIDHGAVRDVIDLWVDGANVSARAHPDSVVCIVADLARAALGLARGDMIKAVVPFREEPWELVAVRRGGEVLVTFYRGGSAPEVTCKDAPVGLGAFVATVAAAAETVLSGLTRMVGPTDPLARELAATIAGLAGLDLGEPSAVVPPTVERVSSGAAASIGSDPPDTADAPLSFCVEIDVPSPRPPTLVGPAARADLHSLLYAGSLCAWVRGRRYVFEGGFPYLHAERLQHALYQALLAWEEGRRLSIRLKSGDLLFSVQLDAEQNVSFGIEDVQSGRVAAAAAVPVGRFAEAILALSREVRRLLCEVDRAQSKNLRLSDFVTQTRVLADLWRELCREDSLTNDDPAPYVASLPQRRSRATLDVGHARRLRYEPRWRLSTEGIDFGSTYLCGERLLATASRGVMAIDRRTGESLWQRDADRAVSAVAGRAGLLRARPDGDVELWRLEDGEPLWRTQLRPRAGGAPFVFAAGGSNIPRIAVAAEAEKRLVGIDLRTGQSRWRYDARRAGAFRARRAGRLLYLASGESSLVALDVIDGTVVWRLTARARFATTPVFHRDSVLAAGGEPPRASRLYCADAFTGELRWSADLQGALCAPPGCAAGVVLAVCRDLVSPALRALSIETGEVLWKKSVPGLAEGFAAMAVDDAFVFNTAGGEIFRLDATTGKEEFRTRLSNPRRNNVPRKLEPVLRGGALFVPSGGVFVVRAGSGEVVSRVEGCTLVPDYLRVDEDCNLYVGEQGGYLGCWAVGARLTVVK